MSNQQEEIAGQWTYLKPPGGPCVVEFRSGDSYSAPKVYGPFVTVEQAEHWMDEQFRCGFHGSFSVVSLRTPNRVRGYDDWWLPEHLWPEEWHEEDHPSTAWFQAEYSTDRTGDK